ncbi:MAG: hypothetical protein ABSF52_10130 [Syntrophobacteraceae bacterium]|jgi:hypothetical protein
MNTRKIVILACIGLALFMIVPATPANAQCYYCNPLLFPFAVAAAAVGTAAAIATAPFCPYCGPHYYYAPPPAPVYYGAPPPYPARVWIRGHYNRYGAWVPGHWRHRN